jgi:hypothetical protein
MRYARIVEKGLKLARSGQLIGHLKHLSNAGH